MDGSVYDVFISFRGIDTRSGFTGNLHRALQRKEIKSFMDDEDLEKGAEINPAIDKAIQSSRIALVVLSKNYASSTFCLDELEKIMDCSKDKGMFVLPVFYKVDPSNVRYQIGKYADAMNKHEARMIDEKEKIEKWRFSLTKISNLSGWHFNPDRYEYDLIDIIVEDIIKKIHRLRDGEKEKIICNVEDKHVTKLNDVEYLVTDPTREKSRIEQFNDKSIAGILNSDSRKMMAAAALIQHRFRRWRLHRKLSHMAPQAIKIQPPMTTVVLKVPLHCQGCIDGITKIVNSTKGVRNMSIEKEKGTISLKGTMDVEALVGDLMSKLKRKVEVVPPKKEKGNESESEVGSGGDKEGSKKKNKDSGGGGGEVEQGKTGYFALPDFNFTQLYPVKHYLLAPATQIFNDENPCLFCHVRKGKGLLETVFIFNSSYLCVDISWLYQFLNLLLLDNSRCK